MTAPQRVLQRKPRAEANPPCHDESYFGVAFTDLNLGLSIANGTVIGERIVAFVIDELRTLHDGWRAEVRINFKRTPPFKDRLVPRSDEYYALHSDIETEVLRTDLCFH